jgi:integrase
VQCERLYDDVCRRRTEKTGKPWSTTTQRGILTAAKTFAAWCVERRWLRSSPLAAVKPRGKLKHGKPQLRNDEARRWYETAMRLAPTTPGAVAALCALLLGMRASEVTSRVVRDLDDDGKLLWIPESKTEAGRRTLELPRELRPLLRSLAEAPVGPRGRKRPRGADDLLFGADKRGRPHTRGWVLWWVKRISRDAGVPTVSAHSMRGLNATLALRAGATAALVAQALGHASEGVTLQSYAAPGSAADAAARKGLEILQGGKRRKRGL